MIALVRPRFDANCNMMFDGKISIWPFTNILKAKRSSKNRSKGTNELKPIVSARKKEVRDMLIKKKIHAIVQIIIFDIKRIAQPTMSRYLNVSDLGFFNSLRYIHYRNLWLSYEHLYKGFQSTFNNFKFERVCDIWVFLQAE